MLAFGLALANLRQLTSELGRVWLIVGAAWFFFLRAGPLTERLARGGSAAGLVRALRLAAAVRRRRAGRRDGGHARHGPAADRRLRRRARSSPRRWRCGGTSAAASVGERVRARRRCCSPAGSARSRSALFASARIDSVTASRLESVAAPFASINDQLALVSLVPARRAGRRLRPRRRRRGAASRRSRGCSGVPAQIHSDYTFTALVGVFGPAAAWAVALGMRALAAPADPPPRPRHARRAAPGRRAAASSANDGQALLSWIAVAWVVLTLVPARRHRRRQPRRAAAHRRHLSVRQLRHDVAARQHGVPRALPQRRPAGARAAMAERRDRLAARLRDRGQRRRRAGAARRRRCSSPWVRPADPDAPRRQGATTATSACATSPRCKTFERAIVRRARGERRRVPTRRACSTALAAVPARMARRGRRGAAGCAGSSRRRRRRTAGGADRRPAGRARRRAAALQQPRQRARRASRSASTRRAGSRRRATRWRRRSSRPTRPGSASAVRCADLAGALAALRARRRARCSRRFAWRGTEGARDAGALAARAGDARSRRAQVTRRNPWGGIAGCIYLGRARRRRRAPATSSPARAARSSASARRPRSRRRRAARRAPHAAPPSAPPTALRRRAAAWPIRSTTRAGWCRRRCSRCCSRSSRCASRRARSTALYAEGEQRRAGAPTAAARLARTASSSTARRSTSASRSTSRSIRRCRRWRRRPPPATPAATTSAARSAMRRAEDARRSRSARSCSKARWCGWRRSRSSTSPAAASRRSPARSRRARARRSTAPAATPAATRACPIRCSTAPDALLNPAVFHDAMPASTIKPIMAAAFLADPRRRRALARAPSARRCRRDGAPARDSLRGQLMRSDSARFLDRMFCIEQRLRRTAARPWEVQATARAFGWNAGCADGDARLRQARPAVRPRRSARGDAPRSRPAPTRGRLRPAAERAGRPASSARRCA